MIVVPESPYRGSGIAGLKKIISFQTLEQDFSTRNTINNTDITTPLHRKPLGDTLTPPDKALIRLVYQDTSSKLLYVIRFVVSYENVDTCFGVSDLENPPAISLTTRNIVVCQDQQTGFARCQTTPCPRIST